MTRHDPMVRMRHMIDHAQEAVGALEGKTRDALGADRILQLALTRLLEIVGEAANRVSKQEQAEYPQIPWRDIVGLRNRITHGYDQVDLDIVWEIAKRDLPSLIAELEKVVPPGDDLKRKPKK